MSIISMPTRRDMITGGAAGFAASWMRFTEASAADSRSIREKWQEVLANAEKFHKIAVKRQFTGSWEYPTPITLSFSPPANELQVASVELRLGERLPEGLRRFVLEATSAIEIYWLLPGKQSLTPEGLTTVEISILPPEPLVEISTWGGPPRPVPRLNGSHFKLSLDDLPQQRQGALEWIAHFESNMRNASDDDERLHYQRYADFWRRGIALATGGGGDVIAADRNSDDGSILFLSHEGADEPGWFLERSLIDLMVDVSRLGFTGPDDLELILFRQDDRKPGPQAMAYAEKHGAEAKAHGLAMPESVVLSPDSTNGYIWRRWLGMV